MDYKLTSKDLSRISSNTANDPVIRFLKAKEDMAFKIGDVLIKLHPRNDANGQTQWVPETISYTTDAAKKYIYVHEDELGIGYVKPVLVNGQLGKDIYCMTSFNYSYCKFQLDPEYADHLMLSDEGESFDAIAIHKQKKEERARIYKANKTNTLKFKSKEEFVNWLRNVNVGDQFWFGNTMDDMVDNKFEVVEVKIYMSDNAWEYHKWTNWCADNKLGSIAYLGAPVLMLKVLETKDQYWSGSTRELSYDDTYNFISFTKPAPLS